MKLVYTGRWWAGCYIWYTEEGTGWGRSPPRPLLGVPKYTSPPINHQCTNHGKLIADGSLFCGFNVSINIADLNFR